jgi:hypothetical protein
VELFGMFSGEPRITTHSIGINLYQAAGLSHPIAFDDMLKDGNNGRFRQSRVEKHRAATLGKGLFTNQTIQQSRVVRPVATVCFVKRFLGANANISFAPNTVLGTLFILTTKLVKIVHDMFLESKILNAQNVRQNAGSLSDFKKRVNTNRSQGKKPHFLKS